MSIEIEKQYNPTFERLGMLSNYPKYYQSIWKRFLFIVRREDKQKQNIIADHLIQWCKSNALSYDLTFDVQSNQNDGDEQVNICGEKNLSCMNSKCSQTIMMKQKKLISLIKGIENFNEYGQRILYRHDFNSLIRTIHECDNCKCPKAILEHCQVPICKF